MYSFELLYYCVISAYASSQPFTEEELLLHRTRDVFGDYSGVVTVSLMVSKYSVMYLVLSKKNMGLISP